MVQAHPLFRGPTNGAQCVHDRVNFNGRRGWLTRLFFQDQVTPHSAVMSAAYRRSPRWHRQRLAYDCQPLQLHHFAGKNGQHFRRLNTRSKRAIEASQGKELQWTCKLFARPLYLYLYLLMKNAINNFFRMILSAHFKRLPWLTCPPHTRSSPDMRSIHWLVLFGFWSCVDWRHLFSPMADSADRTV